MITILLRGGLGNQLFQRAYGLALEHRGYQVVFNKSLLIEGTHREYSLGIFGDLKMGEVQNPVICELDDNILYKPDMLRPPDSRSIVGNWQSEKYFADIADKVRKAFIFPRPMLRHNSPTIALHIRRQDYVGLQHFHGLPTLDYYRAAVEYILTKMGPAMVFVFSDDRQWCRENLPADFRVVERTTKYEDLQMMAECTHIVTANSSFSWWAAWLGDNRSNSVVIAPKKWYTNPAMSDDGDLVPERWVKI